MLMFLFFLLSLLFTTPVWSATYFVSTSGSDTVNSCGTAQNGGNNPNDAKRNIMGTNGGLKCLAPGDTLYIRGGNYSERLQPAAAGFPNGTGDTNRTKIMGYGGENPHIGGVDLGSNGDGIIKWNWLLFKDFIIDGALLGGPAADSPNGVFIADATNIIFDNLDITNGRVGIQCGGETSGGHLITNSRIYHNYYYGTYWSCDNSIFDHVDFYDNFGYGVHVYDTFLDVSNNIIRNSRVFNNGLAGVAGVQPGGLLISHGTNNQAYNNLVYHNQFGIHIHDKCTDCKVYNNTSYDNLNYGLGVGSGLTFNVASTGSIVRNNIVANNQFPGIHRYPYDSFGGAPPPATIDHNLCPGADENCQVIGNPSFINAGAANFQLNPNSEARNKGANLASEGFHTDFGGFERNQGGTWDIGAWEYPEGSQPQPACPPTCPTPPLNVPPLLHVSTTNGRYFANPANTFVYLTGSYDWNFTHTMPSGEATDYLTYFLNHNHSFLRMPSQDYDGTAQSTSYFADLVTRIGLAGQYGFYVMVDIFPNLLHQAPFNNLVFDEAYTRSLVQAVAPYSNVIFSIGNELNTTTLDGGTVGFFVNRIMTVIRSEHTNLGVAQHPVCISDFRADGNDFGVDAAVVSFMLGSTAECVNIGFSYFGTPTMEPLPDYGGQKVSIPDSDHTWPYQEDHKWVWKNFMNGGNPIVLDGNAFYPDHVVPDDEGDTVGAARTYDARLRMGDTRGYAQRLNLQTTIPHPELSSTGFVLANPGQQYLVYQPNTGSFTVSMAVGQYTVEWFDPTAQTFHTASNITITVPGNITVSTAGNPANDAVLFLQQVIPSSGNAIHVAQTGGTPTLDCTLAENPLTPIRTLADGLKCMNTTPGKTMWVHTGTYTECFDTMLTPLKGGNGPSFATATTIATWDTDLVTIRPGACPASGTAFFLQNGPADSFLIFRGSPTNRLVIDGINNFNNVAIYPGAHHVRFEFVDFVNVGGNEIIYAQDTANIELVDSLVHGGDTSGIILTGTTTSSFLLERTMVTNNTGIGIFHNNGTLNGLTVKETTVGSNGGGGISLGTGSGATLINSQVKSNTGIGMLIRSGASNVSIHNDTFYANTGNGIQCNSGASSVSIKNTISTGNGSSQIVNNCSASLASVSETGVIFVGAPTNLHLSEGSEGINDGTPDPSVPIDYDGNPRPDLGGTIDRGAFERAAAPPVTTPLTVKAFPSAEGFGRNSVGGRGGTVIQVTNLNDSGAGSLRACVESTGPRTCVFRVGGVITLSSKLQVTAARSFLTIAGQTAPEVGITLTPWPLTIGASAHDVIIRHVRHRQAFDPLPPGFDGNNDCGAFVIYGDGANRVYNIILDHVSAAWSCDDTIQTFGYVTDTTVQWAIMGEPYCQSADGYGGCKSAAVGGNQDEVVNDTLSWHHNMHIHAVARNPSAAPVGLLDWRYNMVYNWECTGNIELANTDDGIPLTIPSTINFVGNKYVPGELTNLSNGCFGLLFEHAPLKIYVQDNQTPYCGGAGCPVDTFALGWQNGNTTETPPSEVQFRSATPFAAPAIPPTPQSSLESVLLQGVGTKVPSRDALDIRLLDELANRTGSYGRRGAPFPTLVASTNAPTDTDADGMPDAWEDSHGLNKNSAADRNLMTTFGNNGYTNLENYLNELAGDTVPTNSEPDPGTNVTVLRQVLRSAGFFF